MLYRHARSYPFAHQVEDTGDQLPLIPNLDKLFDKGFISFADDGSVMISFALSSAARAAFGVDVSMHLLKPLSAAQQAYMAHHRDHVFKKG